MTKKMKICQKIDILAIEYSTKKLKFDKELKIWQIIENLIKNWKIENLTNNWKFDKKLKIWQIIENLIKNWKIENLTKIWQKIENLR